MNIYLIYKFYNFINLLYTRTHAYTVRTHMKMSKEALEFARLLFYLVSEMGAGVRIFLRLPFAFKNDL